MKVAVNCMRCFVCVAFCVAKLMLGRGGAANSDVALRGIAGRSRWLDPEVELKK
jgi:hypothetical protein